MESVLSRIAKVMGGEWKAVRNGFGWRYECSDGRYVTPHAESVLGHDGYSDEEFQIVYIDNDGRTVLYGKTVRLP